MASIPYPQTFVDGQVLTAADLNSQYGAVESITDIGTAALQVGASTPAFESGIVSSGTSIAGVETIVCTVDPITTRGGKVLLAGLASWAYVGAGDGLQNVTMRFKRNGTQIAQWTFQLSAATFTTNALPTPSYIDSPAAGTWTYTLTAVTTAPSSTILTSLVFSGLIQALELA